jgi:hypothetical protein
MERDGFAKTRDFLIIVVILFFLFLTCSPCAVLLVLFGQ